MIHPDTAISHIDPIVGYGVVATAAIPMGTIMWVRDALDRILSPGEVKAIEPMSREFLDRYSYRDRAGNYVFCWDHTRFMNHSFFPNCLPTPYGFEICVRDISIGEELTNDYGSLNIIEEFTPRDEGHSRKTVRPDDLLHFHEEWDRQVETAFASVSAVDQPLLRWLSKNTQAQIQAISSGYKKPASLRELAFQGKLC